MRAQMTLCYAPGWHSFHASSARAASLSGFQRACELFRCMREVSWLWLVVSRMWLELKCPAGFASTTLIWK